MKFCSVSYPHTLTNICLIFYWHQLCWLPKDTASLQQSMWGSGTCYSYIGSFTSLQSWLLESWVNVTQEEAGLMSGSLEFSGPWWTTQAMSWAHLHLERRFHSDFISIKIIFSSFHLILLLQAHPVHVIKGRGVETGTLSGELAARMFPFYL